MQNFAAVARSAAEIRGGGGPNCVDNAVSLTSSLIYNSDGLDFLPKEIQVDISLFKGEVQ